MKKILSSLSLVFIISIVFLSSCGKKKSNLVGIADTNFQEEIEEKQNLVFYFNKDIVGEEDLHEWKEENYLEFDPPVVGKYKWNSKNELTFSPLKGFHPNTNYKVTPGEALIKDNEAWGLDEETIVEFHTPYMRLVNTNTYWKKDDNNRVYLNADLNFNYAVEPDLLAKLLVIKVEGEEVDYEVITTEPSKSMKVGIREINLQASDLPLEIYIKNGITTPGSNHELGELSHAEFVANQSKLDIKNLEANHNGGEGTITLATSQEITKEGLKSKISFSPAIEDFQVKISATGFVISSSAFDVKNTYTITIDKSLEGLYGGVMQDDYENTFTFGDLKPTIEFVHSKGNYLSGKGMKNLAVNLINIKNVKVEVTKIFENNIMSFHRNGMNWGYHSDYSTGEYEWYDYQYFNTEYYGDQIWENEYETNQLPRQGDIRLLNLDFSDRLGNYEGIYVVKVFDPDRAWLTSSKVISISDIGLIAKYTGNSVLVFANSIHTAKPLKGVDVSFISTNNQKVHTVKTDGSGVAILEDIESVAPGFDVAMITAKKEEDFNYLMFNRTEVATARYEVGGKRSNDAKLEAFIYGERNLYRPGETIHLNTVIRTTEQDVPEPLPYKMNLVLPNGRIYKTIKKVTDKQGSFNADFEIPRSALTGTWSVEVFTNNDVLLGNYNVSIEEFMPDRIKVKLELDKDEMENGDDFTAKVSAVNMFGPPAANRNVEVAMNLRKTAFTSKNYRDYYFNINQDQYFSETRLEDVTNEEGKADIEFQIPAEYKNLGVLKGTVLATVFDETGRPVNAAQRFQVYTQEAFVGIEYFDRYVGTRNPLDIGLIALSKADKVVSAKCRVEIIKHEWETIIRRSGGSFIYESQRNPKTMVSKTVNISGTNTDFKFTPVLSGEYEIRVYPPGSNYNYVSRYFYAYRWGDTRSNAFEVSNEGNIEIQLDKEEYETNGKVKALLKLPFEGKVLVTVERDKVFKHFYEESDEKSLEISFYLRDEHVPNVYISATLIRPTSGKQIPLTVAHGYANVNVTSEKTELPLSIEAVKKSRSKRKQTIKVKTKAYAELTVAVVDEGILQIKNFATPDPHGYFYQKKALEVRSSDLYGYLSPELAGGLLTGGGGLLETGDITKRVNPVEADRIKLVSFWSGTIKANGSGHAEFEIDIPKFSGELRVMVVGYKGDAYGSLSQPMTIADPIVLSTGLPRFLSPGDEVIVPVTISNTTENPANPIVDISASGAITVTGEKKTLSLGKNSETMVEYTLVAKKDIGKGSIKVNAKAFNETFTEEIEIAVRPATPLQKRYNSGMISGDNTISLDIASNFIPSTAGAKLVVSPSPLIEFNKDLEDLVRYPYGCAEQTISVAFPQIYYSELIKAVHNKEDAIEPNYNVQMAIRKIQGMQLYNGGVTYWPGYGSENWWITAYGAHFLIEARKAGFEVSNQSLAKMLDYLRAELRRKKTTLYRYNRIKSKEIAPKEAAYSLYVLALAGQPYKSLMNYYKSKPELLSLDAKYLLAAAYDLTGDENRARQVRPKEFIGEQAVAVYSGSFYSYIRDMAISLNSMLDTDPDNPQVYSLGTKLVKEMKSRRYLNTQERSFAFLALGKIARATNQSNTIAEISINGKGKGKVEKQTWMYSASDLINSKVQIKTYGKGNMYYYWETEGMTKDGSYDEEDMNIRVRRSFYDRRGGRILNNTVEQNDLVVVKISIVASRGQTVENVAITDVLPAGLEIENPRISDIPQLNWIKDKSYPEYLDMRDDRIHFFTTVSGSTRNYYYLARAVTRGTYQLGPVAADCMYDGEYHSYNGGGTFKVE